CFAAWVSGAPALARAMARALSAPRTKAPGIRARISALATGRRKGKARMDPIQLILAAVTAASQADDPKAALDTLIAEIKTIAGGAGGVEPDGDEARKPDQGSGAGGDDMETEEERKAKGGAGAPPAQAQPAPDATGYGRQAARKVSELESRARRAADSATGIAVRARLRELETVDGVKFPENLRLRLSKMTDLDTFERDVEMFTAGRASVQPGNTRARSGQEAKSAPAAAAEGSDPAVDEATLKGEGHNASFIRHYQEEHAANPEAAKHTLTAARRARTQGDPASPWKRPATTNGAAQGRS
ncbi:MAG TPA: hypothetical protein VLC11_03125, partial [Gemmatimonadales bacterium]|nr:hypothetical protein [Gemmatimonadales bacterium]